MRSSLGRLCSLMIVSATALQTDAAMPRVPEGFSVELVAGPEHVLHPMMGCLDDRGRLYICESAGTNRKAAELVADPQDSIKVLEDSDGDGRYDKSWTFADKLVFPQGCLWYGGAVYTCSSPYLWKLEDTDHDGICDRRTVLVKSFGFSGNAADIHGPFLSPDGRLYWCDGRHGHEIHDFGDGRIGGEDNVASVKADPEPGLPNPEAGELLTKGKAARIFSCRPDGTDLRVLCGGGMDNPVEVDFWETGECLGTVNLFYGRPRGDCLVHWVDGGVYPRDDMPQCIEEFPWTGGLLGPVTNYGHVAVSGMCRYRSHEFGNVTQSRDPQRANEEPIPPTSGVTQSTDDRSSPPAVASRSSTGSLPDGRVSDESTDRAAFFVSEFNTHKIVKTIVERDGATFRAVETSDFLVSNDPDFHPTDVLEDGDGSLLVIDTGGWFRIGCPTSQVAKPEIAGGIYRIRRDGAHRIADPYGSQLAWRVEQPEVLLERLSDPRWMVRNRAATGLRQWPNAGAPLCRLGHELGQAVPPDLKRTMLLARAGIAHTNCLERIPGLSSLQDSDLAVRLTWMSACGSATIQDHTDIGNLSRALSRTLVDGGTVERRAAYELLSRMTALPDAPPDRETLLRAMATPLATNPEDQRLNHAAIVALTRLQPRDELSQWLRSSTSPGIQRAALIALDQMDQGDLTRDDVLPLLSTSDAALREAALDVISRRQGWASEAVTLFQSWLSRDLADDQAAILERFVASQAADPAVQKLVAEAITSPLLPSRNRQVLLAAVAAADLTAWPAGWTTVLKQQLTADDPDQRLQVIGIIAARGLTDLDADLRSLLSDDNPSVDLRAEAFSAIAPRVGDLSASERRFFTEELHRDGSPIRRLKVAAALAAVPNSEDQLGELTQQFATIDPAVTAALLPAFERTHSAAVQQEFIAALLQVEQLPPVSGSSLRSLISHFDPASQAAAAPLLARFDAREAESAARIERYLPWAEGGDANRGRYVFFGQTAACGKCHRVGTDGAQIGPDLSKIATIRQPRDLVEAILLPSASFARDFHPYTAVTADGRVVSGLITRQTSEAVVFRLTDLSEVRLRRDDIELLKEAETSIMPQGLETKLNEQEFRDLLAYLQSLK